MADDFTLGGYGALIDAFLARGYQVRSFHNVEPDAQHLVLRHDIDYCIEYALPLAELEQERGVASSYFILMQSEFYNPLTPTSRHSLRRLLDLGHEVGLHFDASQYDADEDILDHACAEECRRLQDIVGGDVKSVSFHRPAKSLMGQDRLLGGRLHAYQSKFFSDMGYCADSQGRFRYGHPLEHDVVHQNTALQLVIHPVWWCRDSAEPPVDRMKRFLAERGQLLEREMAANSLPYREYLENISS